MLFSMLGSRYLRKRYAINQDIKPKVTPMPNPVIKLSFVAIKVTTVLFGGEGI